MTALDLYNLIYVADAYKTSGLPLLRRVGGVWTPETIVANRSAIARRVNKNGLIESAIVNQPLIDFLSGGCPAWLFQTNATNLTTYSNTFTDASWIPIEATVINDSTTSPDGTVNADKLVESVNNAAHSMVHNTSLGGSVDGSMYSISIYVKANGRSRIGLADNNQDTSGSSFFDLSNGTVISGTGKIKSYGNGWYRCSIFPLKNFSTTSVLLLRLVNTGTNVTYLGDGVSGVFLYQTDIVQRKVISSPIPTVAASVLRATDTQNGISLAGCFDGLRGTFIIDLRESVAETAGYKTIYAQGSGGDAFWFEANSNTNTVRIANDSSATDYMEMGVFALVCDENGTKVFRNGTLITTLSANERAPETLVFESVDCVTATRSFATSQVPFSDALVLAASI